MENWFIAEILAEQKVEQLRRAERQPCVPPLEDCERRGVKHAFASTLVRLGLRLDPAAGEGLGAFEVPLAATEARRHA
ncbi:MAG: hypothetical protein U1B78_05785 [Dehalococcoidia bacterium]|nr:hypothetical protein [Dehalococcoidia bacterium]